MKVSILCKNKNNNDLKLLFLLYIKQMTKTYYFPKDIWKIIKSFMFNDCDYDYWKQITSGAGNQKLLEHKDDNDIFNNYVKNYTFEETFEISNFSNDNSISLIIHTRCSDNLLKNLRFKNNNILKEIKYIEFRLGLSITDKISANLYDVLRKFYKMSGMPFYIFKKGYLCCNNYGCSINIKFKTKKYRKITLLVDKYKNNNNKPKHVFYHHVYQNLFCRKFHVNRTENVISLEKLCMPSYFLMCDHKLTKIKLHFDDTFIKLVQEGNMIKLANHVDNDIFNYGINFGKCSNVKLTFNSPDSNIIVISCLNMNLVRSIDDYYYRDSSIMFIPL